MARIASDIEAWVFFRVVLATYSKANERQCITAARIARQRGSAPTDDHTSSELAVVARQSETPARIATTSVRATAAPVESSAPALAASPPESLPKHLPWQPEVGNVRLRVLGHLNNSDITRVLQFLLPPRMPGQTIAEALQSIGNEPKRVARGAEQPEADREDESAEESEADSASEESYGDS